MTGILTRAWYAGFVIWMALLLYGMPPSASVFTYWESAVFPPVLILILGLVARWVIMGAR